MDFTRKPEAIAIIGMSARFCGVRDLRTFWRTLINRNQAATDEPSADPDHKALTDSALVDESREQNSTPHLTSHGTAVFRLLLNLAKQAILDAGYLGKDIGNTNIGLIFSPDPGSTFESKQERSPVDLPANPYQTLDQYIASHLDLVWSECVTAQACANPLAAVDAARQELANRSRDIVVVGSARILSPLLTSADSIKDIAPVLLNAGYVDDANQDLQPGEGAGFLVLKRLTEAERDGNRIYAVVKATNISNQINSRDVTASNDAGQKFALAKSFEEMGIGFETISLIEMNGTYPGLTATDQLQSLIEGLALNESKMPQCSIGSADWLIGRHATTASIAGIIKVALALFHRVLPVTHSDSQQRLVLDQTPFYMNTEPRPWIHGGGMSPRRADVSCIAPYGASDHAVLEEHDSARQHQRLDDAWDSELLVFSGPDRSALLGLVKRVQEILQADPQARLADLASSLAVRDPAYCRLAVIARDLPDLQHKLNIALEKLSDPQRRRVQVRKGLFYAEGSDDQFNSRTAFLFPGFGSYYPNMLADLCLHFPQVREWFDCVDGIFEMEGGALPSQLVFPTSATPNQREAITQGLHGVRGGAQVGFTATMAIYELLRELGINCDVMVGHSNGENAALVASGTIRVSTRQQLFELIRTVTLDDDTSESTNPIPRGAYIGVSGLDRAILKNLVDSSAGQLHIAMDNCPHQVVLFGSNAAIEIGVKRITEAGGIWVRLPFDRAYHTPLYESQANDLNGIYRSLNIGPRHTPVYSCASTQPFPDDPEAIRTLAVSQWSAQVRFRETIERLYDQGINTFIEVGPNSTLTAFVEDTLRGRSFLALASNSPRLPGLEQLQFLTGQLYVRGLRVNLSPFFKHRELREIVLDEGLPAANQPPASEPDTEAQFYSRASLSAWEPFSRAGTTSPGVAQMTPVDSSGAAVRLKRSHPLAQSPEHAVASRFEILQGHFSLMQQFLASQGRVLDYVRSNLAAAGNGYDYLQQSAAGMMSESSDAQWPLLGDLIELSANHLYCERSFNIEKDLFLLDHTLGRRMSPRRAKLFPLPVIPFSVSMEIMAEAAARLLSGKEVIGLRALRGYRWLAIEQQSIRVGVLAELQTPTETGVCDVRVKVFALDESRAGVRQLAFEGVVMLSEQFPASVQPLPIRFRQAETTPVAASDFYKHFAFHGECFQRIKHVRRWDASGIEVEMEPAPAGTFFRRADNFCFEIPADLLDATAQLVGLWLIEQGHRDFAVFPFQARSFTQFQARPPAGSRILCRASICFSDRLTLDADFDLLDDRGRVIARFEALQLRKYEHPYISRLFLPQSSDTFFSERWLEGETGVTGRLMASEGKSFLEGSWGIWNRALAHLSLNHNERETWYRLPEKGSRRTEWLMGRVSSKDAVRQWAMETRGLALALVDIEIAVTEAGKPFVRCPELEESRCLPDLSISHSNGYVIAALADDLDMQIGIDLERIGNNRSYDWLDRAFTQRELGFSARTDIPAKLGLWCAKEAAAKALGTGLEGAPHRWQVVACADDMTSVVVEHEDTRVEVKLWYSEDEVFSLCLTPKAAGRLAIKANGDSFRDRVAKI